MRFIADGPAIPDPLLRARDEGRVVFFCGAGVSRARAGLPDFFGLARSVIHELNALDSSDACKVLNKAEEVGNELDVTGLISADRVFSLLERDFTRLDIQSSVAKSLAPTANVDRSAHDVLLRLARTPTGKTRLVTTNFDRLFESNPTELTSFQPPRLPNPTRYDDLDGIVYLHGRVNAGYNQAEGAGFILSSSDFGHAYLSEGWATEFFREVVRNYVVVFVGYSADDPPVHYLLEGLTRKTEYSHSIYAFQSDETAELISRWKHKGVAPLAYSDKDGHRALWETLEGWATRADSPIEWRQSILALAESGPRCMEAHQRGQIAHIVSDNEGAKAFAEASPPAEWLCVFDPRCRFEQPQCSSSDSESSTIDPFALFGLDSDEIPSRRGDGVSDPQSTVPSSAWDAFEINELDRVKLAAKNFPSIRSHTHQSTPALPTRLTWIGQWIAKVANQSAAAWWAVRQEALHPGIRQAIEWRLARAAGETDGTIMQVWRYLLESWGRPRGNVGHGWAEFNRALKFEGWSWGAVRRYVQLCEPFLNVGPALLARPVPHSRNHKFRISDLARVGVECSVPPDEVIIPDEWVHHVVRGLRNCLETAARISEEVNDLHRYHISPIEADDRSDVDDYQRMHGLSGFATYFASLFERLVVIDEQRAKDELASWPKDEDVVFARLRFWATSNSKLASSEGFAFGVLELTDTVFWGHQHQRDLLIVLARRWSTIPPALRHEIEARILKGPSRYEWESIDFYKKNRAWAVLVRLAWLKKTGCDFSFDLEKESNRLRIDAPNWDSRFVDNAVDSCEMRSGVVATNSECEVLMLEPISTILSKAHELSGRSESDHLMYYDPFSGLSSERPKRAFLALSRAARHNECPQWAWTTFLNSNSQADDHSQFSAVIATRLCRFSNENLSKLIYPLTRWLLTTSKALSADYPQVLDQFWQRLISIASELPEPAYSGVQKRCGQDWEMDAINSPVGHLVMVVFSDVRYQDAKAVHKGLGLIEQCLALPAYSRRLAITIVSKYFAWLHKCAPDWTERNLFGVMEGQDVDDLEALWAGFLSNPNISSSEFYNRIKSGLLAIARNETQVRQEYVASLASLLINGWVSNSENESHQWITNSELRDALLHGGDKLRTHVLYQFERVLRDDDPGVRDIWQSRALKLFREVWPRQRDVKTTATTARLFEVLVAHPVSFSELTGDILPLLNTVQDATRIHIQFRNEIGDVIKQHPVEFLHVIHTVFPDDVRYWPYGTDDALKMILDADASLSMDPRYQELRQKWDLS